MHLQFAQRFATKRKELGYTQEQIATYMGVSRAAVSKWEKGQSYPDITLLPKLATYFNLSIDTLLGYEPQLTEAQIITLYKELANRLHHEPFSDVEATIEQLIAEYYSCFPFLLKMAQLYLNYAPTSQEPKRIAERIETLCARVRQFSDDFALMNEAYMIEAVAILLQQRAEDVLTQLGDRVKIQLGEDQLIAQAYQMLGQIEKAKEVLQASTYQHLLLSISTSSASLLLHLDNDELFEKIVNRTQALIQDWAIQKLNPTIALSFYILAATGYMQLQREKKAMEMLTHYVKACAHLHFPLQLRGDDYFHLIDPWLQTTMQLATVTPRDDASVKRDIIATIAQNPIFTPLHEQKDFQLLLTNLHHTIERRD